MSWDDDWDNRRREDDSDRESSRQRQERSRNRNGWKSEGYDSWSDYDPLDDPEADPFTDLPPRQRPGRPSDTPPPPPVGENFQQPGRARRSPNPQRRGDQQRQPNRDQDRQPRRRTEQRPSRDVAAQAPPSGRRPQRSDSSSNRPQTSNLRSGQTLPARRPLPVRREMAPEQRRSRQQSPRRERQRQDYTHAAFYERRDTATYQPVEENQAVERARSAGEWIAVIAAAVAMAFAVQAFVLQQVYIPSPSMVPTLQENDRVLVNKFIYRFTDVDHNDIVVFHPPPEVAESESEQYIKRVIATEGDVVAAQDGMVFVNGVAIDEPYLPVGTTTSDFDPVEIPPGHMWVMGDNRSNSQDSRVFGPVSTDALVGQGFLKILPLSKIGFL